MTTSINVLGALVFFQGDPTMGGIIGFGITALAIILLTRGRLGYDSYLRNKEKGLV